METEKRHLKPWIGAVVAIVLLAAAGWLGKSTYRHFKEKRSQAQAQAFMAKGDYRNALLSARQTLLLDSTNVEACRVMAGLADISRSPATLDWWQKIVEMEPTIGNKLSLASASLRYQSPPFPLANQIFDELPGATTNLTAYHMVAAEFALGMKHLAEAEAHFEQAARLDPTNKIFKLNLAVMRLNSTNPATAETARSTLKQFQSDKDLGAMALRSLIADRVLHSDLPGARDYSTQLLAGAQANLGDRLQYLGILRQMISPELPVQLDFVQRQSATNALAALETASWMDDNGLSADAVRWLTNLPAGFQAQPPVRLALVNCYLAETNWFALRDFVSRGDWGEMDFLRMAFFSRAWAGMGEALAADSDWRVAVNETDDRFGALNALLELAGRWELKSAQEDLLWRIIKKFPLERWAWHELEDAYFMAGDTVKLNRLYSMALVTSPNDLGIKNNLAATSLLLKTNLAEAFALAKEIYAQKPDDPIIVSTYAYSLHLQGRTREGVAALEQLKGLALEQPSVALYYGVLLAGMGEKEKASHFLALAEKSGQLLPEEKQLLSNAGKTE
jgi:tetratricopeptide (TPR) repeat protein